MRVMRLRRGDYVILAVAVVIAAVCCWQIWRPKAAGETAVIVSPAGEQQYPLSQEMTFTVAGDEGIVLTVEIQGGRVRVRESGCPDQVCVHSGWLSQNGQTAACVPAGVSVRVIGGSEKVDGVTA